MKYRYRSPNIAHRKARLRKRLIAAGTLASLVLGVWLLTWISSAEPLQMDPQAPRSASFALDCAAPGHAISPLIYGIGGSADPWSTGTTARRWGGNPTTRYNWELDTSNAANDWYFKNSGGQYPRTGYLRFVDENAEHGVVSAVTMPMIGWVAKDASSYGFPVSIFGPQKATAPEQPDAGNGVGRDGKAIPPGSPTQTSVQSTPESIERAVRAIRERSGGRGVDYILDNEPMLWNATHRDVHPEPTTYDELLERTIAYGTAIRRGDPRGRIAGPAEWGWLGYLYSAKDVSTSLLLRPDRRRHGDLPLIPWYLRKLREHAQQTGVRILDIVDVHFYPMGDGIRNDGGGGGTDPVTAARRLRSTRALWDPTYRDESWINERVRLIPMIREWIAENYPGLGISIGEWDFGGEKHMSGGLATAEALGRFGTEGVTSAYRWIGPPEGSPTFWAFRAFRNFDERGGRFLDRTVPVTTDGTLVSLFASRDADRRKVVAVMLNLAPLSRVSAQLSLQGCGAVGSVRAFSYAGGIGGFAPFVVTSTTDSIKAYVPPYTITVFDVTLAPPSL